MFNANSRENHRNHPCHYQTDYKRVTWTRNDNKRQVWRCTNRLEHGTKYCKCSPTVSEELLHAAILQAINEFVINKDEITHNLQTALILAIEGTPTGRDIAEIESDITKQIDRLNKIVSYNAKHNMPVDCSDGEIKEINERIRALHAEKDENMRSQANRAKNNAQIKKMLDLLENETFDLTEYNEIHVRHLIHEVTVMDELHVQVDFKNGYRVMQEI